MLFTTLQFIYSMLNFQCIIMNHCDFCSYRPVQTRNVGSRDGPGVNASVEIVFSVASDMTTEEFNSVAEGNQEFSFTG